MYESPVDTQVYALVAEVLVLWEHTLAMEVPDATMSHAAEWPESVSVTMVYWPRLLRENLRGHLAMKMLHSLKMLHWMIR